MPGVNVQLIQINGSPAVLLPVALMEQAGLGEQLSVSVQGQSLVISSSRHPREGWEEQYQKYAEEGGDEEDFQEPLLLTEWEEKEWEW